MTSIFGVNQGLQDFNFKTPSGGSSGFLSDVGAVTQTDVNNFTASLGIQPVTPPVQTPSLVDVIQAGLNPFNINTNPVSSAITVAVAQNPSGTTSDILNSAVKNIGTELGPTNVLKTANQGLQTITSGIGSALGNIFSGLTLPLLILGGVLILKK